jgi:hypothetical protein
MPGYGIVGPDEGSGLLPWSWAEERLQASHDFWLATQWPDGHPHVMPVWGVWSEDALWFSSSPTARKARNLELHPRAVATTDDALAPVIVEGDVVRIHDVETIEAFVAWVNTKYETDYSLEFFASNACYRLDPVWAFGLSETDFVGSPTRWVFP